jgi:hypothetical protein
MRQMANGEIKRYYRCHGCGKRFSKSGGTAARKVHPRRLLAIAATEKECSRCHRILPVACFRKKPNDPHLYCAACKECLNAARRQHFLKACDNGLSAAEYAALVALQGDRCAICGTTYKGKRFQLWPVDHDHRTGQIRGLLCSKCNLGLGNFDDDADRLEAAVNYLRRPVANGLERR